MHPTDLTVSPLDLLPPPSMAKSSPDASFRRHCRPSASSDNLSLMLEAKSSLYALGAAASTSKITLQDVLSGPSPSPLSSPPPTHQQRVTRHPDFWLYDGSIVLNVQNTLFRVHQTILAKHSEVFADLFTLPQPLPAGSGEDDEGVVEGCPVVEMHDCATDFADLLHAIYHPRYDFTPYLLSCRDVSCKQAILKISPRTPTWTRSSPLSRASLDCPPNTSFDISANDASPFFLQNFLRPSRITSIKRRVPPQIAIEATPSCVPSV